VNIVKKALSAMALFLFLIIGSNPAFAHAQLITTTPLGNSIIQEMPDRISLEFGEQMLDFEDGNLVTVTDSNNNEISFGPTVLNGAIIYRMISTKVNDGVFKVHYRAISNDGHKVTGDFQFELTSINNSKKSTKNNNSPSPVPSQSTSPVPNVSSVPNLEHSHSSHFLGRHFFHIFIAIGALLIIGIWSIYRRKNN